MEMGISTLRSAFYICTFLFHRNLLPRNLWICKEPVADWLAMQSLKSRGIRFPGRDEESLAPIFTPPQSVSRSAAGSGGFDGSAHSRDLTGFLAEDVSPENTKEVFDVARNSVELLNTVLTSSPQQEALKVCVHSSPSIFFFPLLSIFTNS